MLERQPNFVSSRHYIEVAEQFTDIGFWNADMATGRIRATHGFFKIIGLRSEASLDLPQWLHMVHPEDEDDFRSIFSIVDTGVPVSREIRLLHSGRSIRWIRVAVDRMRQGSDSADLVIGLVQDMTEEREARAAVHRQRARLNAFIEMTGDTFWATDLNGIVTDLKGWEAITGQSREQARGNGWIEAVHENDRERVLETWSACFHEARPYAISYRLRYADGMYRSVTVRGMPVRSESGRPGEWLGTIEETWRGEGADPLHDEEAALQPQQLRAARAMLGWSAAKLAREAGISTATIRRYETGEYQLKEVTVAAILSALAKHGVVMTRSPVAIGLRLSVREING